MELVEGDDLSARIQGRPLPLAEAIEIAQQVAAALEEAHAKGIVHRDLKPANIKVTADGKVKVLDFGLAKALGADPTTGDSSVDLSRSPTMTVAMGTQAGLILGTASYMAPEQARGKAVDRRADIWAFGVVLFEMLTGERLFVGETVTDIIAAVVTREPDWSKLPADTPAATRRLLRRCLQKDPRKRLRDVGDAALELDEESGDESAERPTPALPVKRGRAWLVGAAGLALGLVLALATWAVFDPDAETPRPTWSSLPPPGDSSYDLTRFIEISPDGRHVAFVAPAPDGEGPLLWVRDLDAERPRPLLGTDGAQQPFWSPDSRSIGYFDASKLRRVSVDGGVAKTLADSGIGPRGACWGTDDTILFVPDWSQPVFRVPASGGTAEAVTRFNTDRLELSHRWPQLLPDGRHFLFFVVSTYPALNPQNPTEADKSGLYIGSLDGEEPRLLQTARSRAVFRRDSLLYVDDGILMARPFDLESLSFRGEAVSIAEGVTQSVDALWGGSLFSVSDEGTLLFARGAPELRSVSQLQWRDRTGQAQGTLGEPQAYNSLRISHDGRRLATSIGDPGDLWMHDLERGNSARFTFDPGNDVVPIWSPDDGYVLFQSNRVLPGHSFAPGNLFRKASSGLETEEHLAVVEFGPALFPADWSPDGIVVVLTGYRTGSGADILLYSLDDGAIRPHIATETDEELASFSPDGRWLAFQSNESGRYEIYVTAFPGGGGKWQLSTDGGTMPVWRADGRELFYLGPHGMMAVPVDTTGGFRHDPPVRLFEAETSRTAYGNHNFAVTPDGERFLLLTPVENGADDNASVTLLQHWRSLLE